MGSLSGIRPPQFSEEEAWLPAWLQQCNFEKLNVEDITKDEPTFLQRVEEWKFLHMSISSRESLREECRCNIGQLFLSGSDCSPFSFAQSPDNVVKFHFHLSSDGNSENTTLTTDACQPEADSSIRPLECTPNLGQTPKVNLLNNCGAASSSPTVEIEVPAHKNELKLEENVVPSEAASDAVELCIAASEALVINEVVKSDSFLKSCSASAILEASLQVKQARLEGWTNTTSSPIHEMSEVDDLSDLDDITMESVYVDAGIHVDELPEIELSVSLVKETLESEYDYIQCEKKDVPATKFDNLRDDSSTQELRGFNTKSQLGKDIWDKCFVGDSQMEITDTPIFSLETDGLGYQNNCSISTHAQRCQIPVTDNDLHETNTRPSPVTNLANAEQDENLPNRIQERFQSRWFGGWAPQTRVKCINIGGHNIQRPFAAETSFLSESADVAPDENSFVQNHGMEAIAASQLSKPSENFTNTAKAGIFLSQDDARCSSASLVDPLCSVVPCSIEITCSSPAPNNDKDDLPEHLNVTNEHITDCLVGESPSNTNLGESESFTLSMSNVKDQLGVYRKFTSLSYYSKQLPTHAKFLEKDGQESRPFFAGTNRDFQKEDVSPVPLIVNRRTHQQFRVHNLAEENPSRMTLAEMNAKCPLLENHYLALSECKNQSAQGHPASKYVHFSEKQTEILDNTELQKVHTTPRACSPRVAKRPTLSIPNKKSRFQQLDRFIMPHLGTERKRLIFQNMEFILTGLSGQKEKEIEGLIRKYGGVVVSQIPLKNLKGKRSSSLRSQVLPVVLCLKKIQSLKFLYGCAVNAFILKVSWLTDSIAAGSVLLPKMYTILSRNIRRKRAQIHTAMSIDEHSLVFNNVGIMLHGKNKFFTNIATIIKHGGGHVFKTLHRLVHTLEAGNISEGVIVADDERCVSRQLRQCALEQNIPLTSVHWIIRSLYAGRLVSLEEEKSSQPRSSIKQRRVQDPVELSQEI